MPHDYKALNKMVRRHKSALTRAKNSGDPKRVIAACDSAFAEFDQTLWPDNWHLWNIARSDAEFELARSPRSAYATFLRN